MKFPNDNFRCGEERLASTVEERQHSLNPVVRTRATHSPKNKPDESRTGRPAFIEDFLQEHSRFGQQADSIEFASCF